MVRDKNIDHGRAFDWGKASADYAKFRDIYPEEFYQRLLEAGLCVKGQSVLDIGTGTGVLPRNMARYGADFIGIDRSKEQIEQAVLMAEAKKLPVRFQCVAAEEADFAEKSFDVVTACQCFTYFNHEVLAPLLHRILKDNGKFAVLYMAWLPLEDEIAGKSEELVLKYNPLWTGGGEQRHGICVPKVYDDYFIAEHEEIFDLWVPFDRESWNGRMKSCRGIGASLSAEDTELFEEEHRALLDKTAPESFSVLHYAAVTVMKKK